MDLQTSERAELYEVISPPGDPIPINVEPFKINDEVPDDVELRGVVGPMRNGRAGGTSGIRAEHIKGWQQGVLDEDDNDKEGAGDK